MITAEFLLVVVSIDIIWLHSANIIDHGNQDNC